MRPIGLTSAIVLLSVGAVVMSPVARAADVVVPQAQYEAAYAAAADASGVFVSGTTVSLHESTATGGDLDMTVNADGSLVGSHATNGNTTMIRCVRVDRCWEQDAAAFGDLKWHRLPAGSVTYQLGRDFWSTWMGFPWESDALYGLATGDDGTTTYMVGFSTGDMTVVNAASFAGPSVSNTVYVMGDAAMMPVSDGQFTASPTHVAVTAPAKRSMGPAATQIDRWTVPINH
jgi:hypothetical protein